MIEKTEYQCFRKLLEEVFEIFSGRKEAYKKYGDADYQELVTDINNTLGSTQVQAPSIVTLKRHLNLKEKDGLPRISSLNLYCQYCMLKKSDWCKTDKWRLLVEANKNEDEPAEKPNEPPKPEENESKIWDNLGKIGLIISILLGIMGILTYFQGHPEPDPGFAPPLQLTVYVHGEKSKQDIVLENTGKLIVDFGHDRDIEPIGANGRTNFGEISERFLNKEIGLSLEAEGYKLMNPNKEYIYTGDPIYIGVKKDTIVKRPPPIIIDDPPIIDTPPPTIPKREPFKLKYEQANLDVKLLKKGIEGLHGNYSLDNDMMYTIDITYTGDIRPTRGQFYRYNGGYLLLKINGTPCFIGAKEEFYLNATGKIGNAKSIVLEDIESAINEILRKEVLVNKIIDKIKECI